MEAKAKFIIFGLIGLSIVGFVLFIQTLNSKQLILRERDELKKDNTVLNGKIDNLENSLRDYENKIGLLNKELDRSSREKQEVERKLDLVNRERVELVEKLKSRPVEQPVTPQPQALPSGTDAYWAGILKAKTDLELQLGNLRNDFRATQISNEQLQREKSTFELDINNLKRESTDLKRQLEYNQKIMDSVTQELVRERNDKIKIQEAFTSIRNENTILTRQLKSINERKVNLEKKLQELQEKNAAIERKFTEMQSMLTEKVSQISAFKEEIEAIRTGAKTQAPQEKKESVELPPIVVRPQSETSNAQAAATTLTGKILAINKDTNFVIIDLGEEAGINVGDSFQVYRDDSSIATIEVIQTRKNIAACDIKKESAPVKIGDTVR